MQNCPVPSRWIAMPPLDALLSAMPTATRFLEAYTNGGRGYTGQDVRAGISRLELLCKALAAAEHPSVGAAQRAGRLVEAAKEVSGGARDRLNGIVRA